MDHPPIDPPPAEAAHWLEEQAPVGLLRLRLDGTLLAANAAFCELLGYPREALAGVPAEELTHPDDRAAERAHMAELVRGAKPGYTAERRYLRVDGAAVWTKVTAYVVRDAAGQPAFVAMLVEDIRERRARDEERRAAEQELLALATLAPVGIFRADPSGRCVFVNTRWTRITGRSRAAALGDAWVRWVHPGDAERVAAVWRETVEGGAVFRQEYRILRPDGAVVWVLCQAIEATDARGEQTFIGTITDITAQKTTERALRVAEERFRRATEVARVFTYDVDLETGATTLYGLEAITGTSPAGDAEAGNAWWRSRIHSDDLPRHRAELEQHIAAGGIARVEYRVQHASHDWLDVEDAREIVLDEHGRAVRMLGAIVDVTARKRTEAAIRASEAAYRSLFESAGTANAEIELATGRFLRVNRRYCELTGYTEEELIGKSFLDITHPDEHERDAGMLAALARGRAGRAQSRFEVEKRYVRKDGGVVWVHLVGTSIRDHAGAPIRLLGSAVDITARRQAEESERRAVELLRALANVVPGIVWSRPPGGRTDYVSDQWYAFTGGPREMPVGDAILQALHPEDAALALTTWAEVQRSGTHFQAELRLRDVSGEYRWFLVRASPARDDEGRITRWFGIATDISEHKAAQEELGRALRYHDVFVGVLGHDLRNPLGAILGAAELGQRVRDPDALRPLFARIENSGLRMERMIEQLLDVTRIRAAGGLELRRAEADLAAICRAAIDELQGAHERAEIALDVTGAAAGVWDADRLTQLVSNLVGNAVEHASGGRGVTVAIDGTDADAVTLRVHNEGAIPEAVRRALFEPFRRAPTARKSAGLGLGLYITQQIALAHGGRVEVDSDLERGTAFTVVLPRAAASCPERRPPQAAELPIVDGGGPVEQLSAEERLAAYRALAEHGHEIILVVHPPDGRILEANAAATAAYRYSRDELLALRISELRVGGGTGLAEGAFVEELHRRKDGSTFEVEVASRSIELRGERRRVHIVRDISARREAERAIRASEQRLRAVFDASPLGIVVAGPDLVFRAVNRAYADMVGYDPTELVGRTYALVTHPDDLAVNVQLTDQYFADEAAPGYAIEKRYLHKDGTTIWVRVTARPFVESDTGARLVMGMIEDITSRRQLDQARRDSEQMLAAIWDCVVLIGADWRYRFVNGRAAEQLGRAAGQLIGRSVWGRFPGTAQTRLAAVMREVMVGEHADPVLIEEYVPASDRWHESTVSRCDDGILVVWRDVTERKQGELTLRQALRLRDEFISVSSHELRTPLAALVLHLDSLERLVGRGAETEYLLGKIRGALRQSERLEMLVEELLDGSRLASGRLTLSLASFDIRELVDEVAERMRDPAARSGCTLNLHLGTPAVGTWDRARLARALGNLVGNAIKYGPRAPVDIEVRASKDLVEIAVRDRGIGVTDDDRARIFGRFERAVPHTHYGGLGLGLYIARQIVEAHGGTIDVHSVPGEGATFFVRLPRSSVNLGAPA